MPVRRPAAARQLDYGGEVAVVAGAGADAADAGDHARRHGGGGIGGVGHVHRLTAQLVFRGLDVYCGAQRHVIEYQLAGGALQVVAGDRDLLLVHAVADDQDHIARFAGGSRCGCGANRAIDRGAPGQSREDKQQQAGHQQANRWTVLLHSGVVNQPAGWPRARQSTWPFCRLACPSRAPDRLWCWAV